MYELLQILEDHIQEGKFVQHIAKLYCPPSQEVSQGKIGLRSNLAKKPVQLRPNKILKNIILITTKKQGHGIHYLKHNS